MTSSQGFYKLKGIKDRSNRLDDCAKKQNGYQERRLNKYLVCIKKEHEGTMDKLKIQERELNQRNSMLSEYLQKEQERKELEEVQRQELISNPVTVAFPSIDERRGGTAEGRKGNKQERRGNRMESKTSSPKNRNRKVPMRMLQRRGSVNIQLLHVVGSTSSGMLLREQSDEDISRPSTGGLKLPPLREELATNRR